MKNKNRNETDFWSSARGNKNAYMMYVDRLTELAISMFEWKNLPDTIDERYMELCLFGDGCAVFFEDEELGFLALQTRIAGPLNPYRIPINRTAWAVNGYNKELTIDNSVIIFNNMIHTNTLPMVELFAQRLWDLDRTIDVNAKAQKTPILIACDDTQRLSLKNVYMQYTGNEPVIWGDKNLNPNSLKVLNTGAPYVAADLYTLKTQIWNEALTFFGISNISYQKKERMISDEIMRSMGGTIASRYSRLNARRQACEQINRMFDLDIQCNFREDYREIDDEIIITGDTGDGGLDVAMTDLRSDFNLGDVVSKERAEELKDAKEDEKEAHENKGKKKKDKEDEKK